MKRSFETSPIEIDAQGYARLDGVCIGRIFPQRGRSALLQVKDRNRRRRIARGREFVYASLEDLIDAMEEKKR